uniref:Transmembrane protein n=1 Tax=Chenopodium quinoa TaxID=63459 RepID=A0A803N8Q5_CHEQI
MPVISTARSLRLLVFLSSFLLHSFTGLSNDTPRSKNNSKDGAIKTHNRGIGTKVAIICIAVAAVVLFSFFLFKLWQKKKREEQYARLLKLFEEDDELEVELGLRD